MPGWGTKIPLSPRCAPPPKIGTFDMTCDGHWSMLPSLTRNFYMSVFSHLCSSQIELLQEIASAQVSPSSVFYKCRLLFLFLSNYHSLIGRKWQPMPVLLPGKFHGWRNLVGYSPWGCKEWDTTKRLHYRESFMEESPHQSRRSDGTRATSPSPPQHIHWTRVPWGQSFLIYSCTHSS